MKSNKSKIKISIKKSDVKVRKYWAIKPVTKIHEPLKKKYNRSQNKQEWRSINFDE